MGRRFRSGWAVRRLLLVGAVAAVAGIASASPVTVAVSGVFQDTSDDAFAKWGLSNGDRFNVYYTFDSAASADLNVTGSEYAMSRYVSNGASAMGFQSGGTFITADQVVGSVVNGFEGADFPNVDSMLVESHGTFDSSTPLAVMPAYMGLEFDFGSHASAISDTSVMNLLPPDLATWNSYEPVQFNILSGDENTYAYGSIDSVSVVPEPASVSAFLAGFGLLASANKKRAKKK